MYFHVFLQTEGKKHQDFNSFGIQKPVAGYLWQSSFALVTRQTLGSFFFSIILFLFVLLSLTYQECNVK